MHNISDHNGSEAQDEPIPYKVTHGDDWGLEFPDLPHLIAWALTAHRLNSVSEIEEQIAELECAKEEALKQAPALRAVVEMLGFNGGPRQ